MNDVVSGGNGWGDKVAQATGYLADMVQVECSLKHHFAPGVYVREIFMPAGSVIIGKIHRTEHFNIIQQGAVSLFGDGTCEYLRAPHTFISKPGVQKVLYIHEDCVWSTVHLTAERDLGALEAQLIEPSETYPQFDRTAERAAIALAAAEVAALENFS